MALQIAVLGATGHIGKGLSAELVRQDGYRLSLLARDPSAVEAHISSLGDIVADVEVVDISDFGAKPCDVVINAIGAGDPGRLAALGHGIFRLTEEFDNRILDFMGDNPETLYLNISSGAVYGAGFAVPPNADTVFEVAVNDIPASRHYGLAKLNAEAKHRAHGHLNIIDLRVFSFFSRFIDLSGRFFMADLARCLINTETFVTDGSDFYRDYITPGDMAALVGCCVARWQAQGNRPVNVGLDCYSSAPVGKFELIERVNDALSLPHRVDAASDTLTTTGAKSQYFSNFHKAADWGYQPQFTSSEGVISELRAIFEENA